MILRNVFLLWFTHSNRHLNTQRTFLRRWCFFWRLKSLFFFRRSSFNIRSLLKDFCRGMLEGGYNVMMRSVKDRISREKAQDSDETYYFWAMSFFLEFNRSRCSLQRSRFERVSLVVSDSNIQFSAFTLSGCRASESNSYQKPFSCRLFILSKPR